MALQVDIVLKLLSSSSETAFFFPPVNGYLLKDSQRRMAFASSLLRQQPLVAFATKAIRLCH